MKGRGKAGKGELDEQLREYINEWRSQRAKEEEELKRLKEKQAKRKEIRAEQEKKLAAQKVIIILTSDYLKHIFICILNYKDCLCAHCVNTQNFV